jgi:nicotinate phosphoribosyltransferase
VAQAARIQDRPDAPYLDCAYKLQEYAGRPRRKRSEGKATWPGRKQVFRRYGADGRFAEDILALADEPEFGEPLLVPVMRGGEVLPPRLSLAEARDHARTQLGELPDPLRSMEPATAYPVRVAKGLRALAAEIDART